VNFALQSEWQTPTGTAAKVSHFALAALLMGSFVALAIDGSPVAIIHLLFWIGLYAVVLAITARSLVPATLFASAVAIAGALDAGYLAPMLQAQAQFPRLTADHFASIFSLLWFALLPARGKVLAANGNGHELSVFPRLGKNANCSEAGVSRHLESPRLRYACRSAR
jgi:hypothetical protein